MNAADAQLFAAYAADRSITNRNRIVERYMELVDVLVAKSTRPLVHLERDDLRSACYIALIGAVERFDPSRGWEFVTFAGHRIRGAIMDESRYADPLTRGSRSRIRAWQKAWAILRARLGREPNDEEVEQAIGLKPGEWAIDVRMSRAFAGSRRQYDHLPPDQHPVEFMCVDPHAGPSEIAESNDQFEHMLSTPRLTPEQRNMLRLKYEADRTLGQVAKAFGCSEAKTSYTCKDAREKIRTALAA